MTRWPPASRRSSQRCAGECDFVRDRETALVVAERSAAATVAAVRTLLDDERMRRRDATAAEQEVRRFQPARCALALLGALESAHAARLPARRPVRTDSARVQWAGTTVVIPVYNAHDEVLRCIDSVINCTAGSYRVLLCNDASPIRGSSPRCTRSRD